MESSFSPRETVSELDKFIIGQKNAKHDARVQGNHAKHDAKFYATHIYNVNEPSTNNNSKHDKQHTEDHHCSTTTNSTYATSDKPYYIPTIPKHTKNHTTH